MNIQETLHFMRTNKKLAQRELLQYVDASVYSKIESGKKNLRVNELLEILDRLSIPFDEFSKYIDIEQDQKKFRSLLTHYKNDPTDNTIKSNLLSYFYSLKFSINMSLNTLSNYVLLKTYFSSRWEEIPELTTTELQQIYELLYVKDYFFHYDYAILANTIYLFNDRQIDNLVKKTFPVQDMAYRNAATKEFITNLINNLITTLLRKEEYQKCNYYLSLAKEEKKEYDLTYKIVVHFLENLTYFLQTNEKKYAEQLTTHINYLQTIEELDLAQSLKKELETLLSKNKEPFVLLRNHFNQ